MTDKQFAELKQLLVQNSAGVNDFMRYLQSSQPVTPNKNDILSRAVGKSNLVWSDSDVASRTFYVPSDMTRHFICVGLHSQTNGLEHTISFKLYNSDSVIYDSSADEDFCFTNYGQAALLFPSPLIYDPSIPGFVAFPVYPIKAIADKIVFEMQSPISLDGSRWSYFIHSEK